MTAVQNYNALINEGKTSTEAYALAMQNADVSIQQMAINAGENTIAITKMTTAQTLATKAFNGFKQIASKFVWAAIISLISTTIDRIHEFVNANETAQKAHEEEIQTIEQSLQNSKKESGSIADIIKSYKEFQDVHNLTFEQKETLSKLEDTLIDKFGAEAQGIDLLNGKYDDNIKKLQNINKEKQKQVIDDEYNNYLANVESYHNQSLFLKQEDKDFLQEFINFERQRTGNKPFDLTDFKDAKSAAEIVGNYYEKFKQDNFANVNENSWRDYLSRLATIKSNIDKIAKKTNDATFNYADSVINTYSLENPIDFSKVTENQYNSWKQNLIKQYGKNDDELIQAITDKIEQSYKNAQEKVKDISSVNAKFDLSSYKDQIDSVQDRISKLQSAFEKLSSGDMSDSDLLDFLQEFPELTVYANDVDELKKHIEELIKTSPNDLIKSLEDLKANLKTDKEIKQVNALISILKKLGDTQFGSNKSIVQTLSADIDKIVNKLNGVVNRHQKIIDNLNDENDRIKDQNEVLQEQLDKYNEIVGKYETTANVVQDYVSKEIEKLENKKQAIEDTYNKEIDKINQRNKETEQSIDLQEKLDALQNAKAKKVMNYSSAKNWHLETDTQAVNEARREYNQAKDDKRIADLESKRDRKTAVYDKQINSLQDYADKWKKVVDSINGKADELIAKEILGANWREKISKKDTSMLKSFKTKYNTYKNVLATGVQKQIEHNEKAIKNNENIIKSEQRVIDSKQKVISEWEAYKDKLTKNVNSLTKANSDYMKSLSDVALTEQTTFKERAKFLSDYAKSFANSAKIINSATDNKTKISATKVPVRKADSNVLKGTGGKSKTPFGGVSSAVGKKFVLVRKEYGGAEKSLSIHSSEKSAKSAYNKYIEERINEFKKSNLGLPQKDFKRAVENFKKNLKKSLIIKSYAKGGTIDYTGIANVHGTPNKSEVVFNSSQAKKLYDIVSNSGSLVSTLSDNVSRGILSKFSETFKNINPVVNNNDNTDNQTNISINVQNVNTPNAKDFMEQMKAYVRKVNRDRIIGRK